MTPEENKARMRYLVEEVQNKGRIELVDELKANDFVNHTPLKGQNPGREGVKEYFRKRMSKKSPLLLLDALGTISTEKPTL